MIVINQRILYTRQNRIIFDNVGRDVTSRFTPVDPVTHYHPLKYRPGTTIVVNFNGDFFGKPNGIVNQKRFD